MHSDRFSPSYFALSAVAISVGFGLWEMRRWSWYLFLVLNLLQAYTSAVLASDHGHYFYKVLTFFLSIALQFFLVLRVGREVKVPYFLPKIRWWETDPRYKLLVPTSLIRETGLPLEGEILDLSLGGCFIKIRNPLNSDELLDLKFTVFGQAIDCKGIVVWRTDGGVTHPRGVGIKFAPLERPIRRVLKAVNQRLKEMSRLYRRSRYLGNPDEFFAKMDALRQKELVVTSGFRRRSNPTRSGSNDSTDGGAGS